mgnify:CR=1 FL=1
MKTQKKLLISSLILIILISIANPIFAVNNTRSFKMVDYSDEYKEWLNLPENEKEKVLQPKLFNISSDYDKNSVVKKIRSLKASATTDNKYSLKDVIPENVVVRDQKNQNACWAFAAIAALESNIAMLNYKSGVTPKVYDYSERHMEYGTSRIFKDNKENEKGYNRNPGTGGSWYLADSYLTNGIGAVDEKDMPFEDNSDIIDISSIQKNVTTQVYDIKEFLATDKTELIKQIKEHVQNNGAVFTGLHGASIVGEDCYNKDTGAVYCNDSKKYPANHAVAIIGWDDNYSTTNFNEKLRPQSNGAWIVKNSWGEKLDYDLQELKEKIFNDNKEYLQNNGINSAQAIPDSVIEKIGFTIKDGRATMPVGDNGIMYVSYEDCNIGEMVYGIEKATDKVNYDYLYQYDEVYPSKLLNVAGTQKLLLSSTYSKQSDKKEYLTQVSLHCPETYICKVYVNPNGTSKDSKDLTQVSLKNGEEVTVGAGYHTLEFSKPIEINSSDFTVVVEVKGTKNDGTNVFLESKLADENIFSKVKVEANKCFVGVGTDLSNITWYDTSKLKDGNNNLDNGDLTIKAFTVSDVQDESLKSIEITTPPTKTTYFEGENFDKTGMIVTANYNNGKSETITDYNITNGTALKEGQTSVTISYQDKTVSQPITVTKNSVTKLEITTPPTKTTYKAGNSFDKTGMVVKATYLDNSQKEITDYEITDGDVLKNGQTAVTISYEGKTVTQSITVEDNQVTKLEITTPPTKVKYVVGQNFDKTGMVVKAKYEDNTEVEVKDYTIENGTNLTKDQKTVTVKYESKTVDQEITVEEKQVESIEMSKKPSKTKYMQNQEKLDLTGGAINVIYNDGSKEEVLLTAEGVEVTGFDNTKVGTNTLTVTYKNKTTTFDVEIEKELLPKNSDMGNAISKISALKLYLFTDKSEKEYMTIDTNVSGIKRYLDENDSYEYYYYMSTNKNESKITDWTKIKEEQKAEDKITFIANTNEMANFGDLSESENDDLYLYIKEVAVRGGNQTVQVSKAMKLDTESDVDTKIYVDNKELNFDFKWDNSNGSNNNNNSGNSNNSQTTGDKTTSKISLPKTGEGRIFMMIGIIALVGVIAFIRYKIISKYVK